MAAYWSDEELAAMQVVTFGTTDAKGKPIKVSTPGVAKVVGQPRPLNWNVQQGMGLSGAVARFAGIGLAKGTITLKMGGIEGAFLRSEYKEMRKYVRGPKQGEPARVYDVTHPRFAEYNPPVLRIHITDDPAGDWDENTQIETVVINWEEDRKPLPTLSSSTTAGQTKDGAKAKNDTRAALQAAIKQNSESIAALGKQLQQ